MICKKIELKNFRNCAAAEVTFGGGLNIVCGDNAQGKTNLVEAVYIFAQGKSFRAARDNELIRFGESGAALAIEYSDEKLTEQSNSADSYNSVNPANPANPAESGETADSAQKNTSIARSTRAEVRYYTNKKRELTRGGLPLERLSELVGDFRAVLFCPEHLGIVKDGPAARRRFLDVAISQQKPVYLRSLQRYNHILQQRNSLLRERAKSGTGRGLPDAAFLDTIEIWSAQLAREAAYICRLREDYVARLPAAEFFARMSGETERAGVTYEPCIPRGRSAASGGTEPIFADSAETEAMFRKFYAERVKAEIDAGGTLWGPHRDDIELTIDGKPARKYGSQGQQRSFSLALKLAEGRLCREECGEYPVFLLDDVLSELDAGRRAFLLDSLAERQVILTTCESEIPGADAAVRINVRGGEYRLV